MERTAVIVGASLAGARAADALRSEGFDGRVVLIGEEAHPPYERPPLSKEILRGAWEPAKAMLRPDEHYGEAGIELWLGERAARVDPAARRVALASGAEVAYDMLLLCTGGRPRVLPVPGGDLDGVVTLRTLDDALAIGARLRGGARLVVAGAGFIGAEVAASARALGNETTVLEMLEAPMVRALGPEAGAILGAIHRDHGVDLRTGVAIERVEGAGRAERVVLADGTAIEADLVVAGVGIEPADELARDAGIACGNGIVVDELCRTSAPDVYAAGDVAEHPNPILGERLRVEHWQNAQNQGVAAAKAMLGGSEPFAEVPWFWSDQYEHNIQMFGHAAGWDEVVFRGDPGERVFAAFYLAGGRVLAALGVGAPKDARAGRDLIRTRAPVTREQLADPATDLRAIAKAAS